MKKYYLIIILLLFTQCDYKPIYSKNKVNKTDTIIVFAWNFFNEIKKNNQSLSDNFINIKDLEKK